MTSELPPVAVPDCAEYGHDMHLLYRTDGDGADVLTEPFEVHCAECGDVWFLVRAERVSEP